MFSYSNESRSFGDVLTDSFMMGIRLFKALFPLALLQVVVSLVMQEAQFRLPSMVDPDFLRAANALVMVVAWFILITIMIALFRRAHQLASGEMSSTVACMDYAAKRAPVAMLSFIGFVFFVMLGTLLFIIPGIVVAISMMFFVAVIAVEDRGLGSLRRSHDLVWGHWWWTFFMFLLWGLIVALVIIFAIFVLGLIGVGVMATFFESIGSIEMLNPDFMRQFNLWMSPLSAAIIPFQVALYLSVLHELKLRQGPGPDDHIDNFKGIAA